MSGGYGSGSWPGAQGWLQAAVGKVSERAKEVSERAREVTAASAGGGAEAMGRLANVGKEVSRRTREAHDALVLLRHSAGPEELPPEQEGLIGASHRLLRVELWAAADLRTSRIGEVAPCCALVVGSRGKPWAAKAAAAPQVKTDVALRQRHPRWGVVRTLRLPAEAGAELELAVRVESTGALRSEVLGEARIPLAAGAGDGAATVRLLGGGFASLSLRWSLSDVAAPALEVDVMSPLAGGGDDEGGGGGSSSSSAVPRLDPSAGPNDHSGGSTDPFLLTPRRDAAGAGDGGEWSAEHRGRGEEYDACGAEAPDPAAVPGRAGDPFGDALAFWTAYAPPASGDACSPELRGAAPVALAELLLPKGAGPGQERAEDAFANELVLQAPLMAMPGAGREAFLALLDAIAARLPALSPLARSRVAGLLVERLEKLERSGPEAAQSAEEALLCALFESLHGEDLMELKRLVDATGQGRDLRHLVFTCVRQDGARDRLLAHFRDAAAALPERPLHVLSDIDMTLRVGTFGAGGPKFPHGPVPGAMALFEAIGGRITFLSARPPVWEGRTRKMLLDEVGIAEAVVLPGSMKAVVQTLFQPEQARRAMGKRKLEVFTQFESLYPEAHFIFFGDSGEGDVDFAAAFMEAPGVPEGRLPKDRRDRAALIHDVVQPDGVAPRTPAVRRAELHLGGVAVFDTYVGAAVELHGLGFLDDEGLRKATESCLAEFSEIREEEFAAPEVFETRRTELLRDLRAANTALRDGASRSGPPPSPVVDT